jgi:hypothetical protein
MPGCPPAGEKIAESFSVKFLNESTGVFNDGQVSDSQCMQSLPLFFGMLPPNISTSTELLIQLQCIGTAENANGHFVGGMFR